MKTDWIATRDGDLGRRSHVRKVLSEAFRGLHWQQNHGEWSDKKVRLVVRPQDADRCMWVEFEIEAADDIDLRSHLGGKFREFIRRRSWRISTKSDSQLVEFPPPKARRRSPVYASLKLDEVPDSEFRRSTETWSVFYVQAGPNESADDVLRFAMGAAIPLSQGSDFGIVSENTCVRLETGEYLYGVGFKREYSFVERALRTIADSPRLIATFHLGSLVTLRGPISSIEKNFVCYEIGRDT